MAARPNDRPDRALLDRVRDVVRGEPTTEAELRSLRARADTWIRLLETRLEASERKLDELAGTPHVSLASTAVELRQATRLRPQVDYLRLLVSELDERARELRTRWLVS